MTDAALHKPRQVGWATAAGGVLLVGSVAAEIVHPVQERSGALLDPPLFFGYLAAWVAGAAALLVALIWFARTIDRRTPVSRTFRIGHRVSVAGMGLLLAFGLLVIGTAAVSGAPAGASFVLFGLGLLLCAVGHAVLAFALRRLDAIGGWWPLLLGAATGALVAVTVFVDPWHDLGLFTFGAAWIALGARLIGDRGREPASALPRP